MQIEREMRWKRGQYRCRGFFPHGSCIKLEHHDWKEERSQVVSMVLHGPLLYTFWGVSSNGKANSTPSRFATILKMCSVALRCGSLGRDKLGASNWKENR